MHLKMDLALPETGMVLEIGGGAQPHPRSDVLVDRFIDDEEGYSQRGRAPLMKDDRPLIHADGSCLPFADSRFGYAIVSHVIEHVPEKDIERFVAELSRVAPAGYIEAPSILYEAFRDIPEHLWYVVCEPGVIHLSRKTSANQWKRFLDPLFKDRDFCLLVEKHAGLFFTGMEWTDGLRVQIHADFGELLDLYLPDWADRKISDELSKASRTGNSVKRYFSLAVPPLLPRAIFYLGRKINNFFIRSTGSENPVNWREIVVCPSCHARLNIVNNRISCNGCNQKYAVRDDGVPSFI